MDEDREWRVTGPAPAPTDAEVGLAPAVWVGHGRPLRVVVLGRELLAVPTHWADGRTVVCWAPAHCGHCATRRARRPQYHLAAWCRARGCDVVVCLGSAGAAALMTEVSRHEALRGLEVILHKLTVSNRSRVTCEVVAVHTALTRLRREFDVRPHLCRVFGVDNLPGYDPNEGGV